jgi:hypothetical protein
MRFEQIGAYQLALFLGRGTHTSNQGAKRSLNWSEIDEISSAYNHFWSDTLTLYVAMVVQRLVSTTRVNIYAWLCQLFCMVVKCGPLILR